MISLVSKGNGFGLYQNISEKRISYQKFQDLLKHLKSKIAHHFDHMLYESQPGYVFYTSEDNLRVLIENFLKNNLF